MSLIEVVRGAVLAGLLSFCYRTRSHTRLAAPLAPPSHTHLPPTLSPLSLSYPSARRVHVPAISAARAACRVTDSPPILSLAAPSAEACTGTISSLDDVDDAVKCTTVNINSFTVPAGKTFNLALATGTTVNMCEYNANR